MVARATRNRMRIERGEYRPIFPPIREPRGDQRPVLSFGLELGLDTIDDPEPCVYCGHDTRREFIDYELDSPTLRVRVPETPGYVCTDCGLETFMPRTSLQILEEATDQSCAAGDKASARFFQDQAKLLRSSLTETEALTPVAAAQE